MDLYSILEYPIGIFGSNKENARGPPHFPGGGKGEGGTPGLTGSDNLSMG